MPRRDGGLRKHSTTLFNGVLSGAQRNWAGLLPDHKNLTNHQVCLVANDTPTAGVYSVRIIPDADGVNTAVDTGLILDLTDKNSAYVNFTGVIRGLQLISIESIDPVDTSISAVISSFSRNRRSWDGDRVADQRLDYVSSQLLDGQSGFSSRSKLLQNHTNMVYHQVSMVADSAIDDQYAVRFIPESESALEATVDTGHVLDFSDTQSALVRFGGVITGVEIEKISGTSSGVPVEAVISSSVERFDEVVYDYIGVSPDLSDHITDYNNPHQTSWNNLLDKPDLADGYPTTPELIPAGESVSVVLNHQYIVWESLKVEGSIDITGRLVVLHDRPETRLREPDFTYNVGGELTQIDYFDGEQKEFTYNVGGQLTQVDSKRDGTTLRKTFTYTGGGELDFITETWL